MAHDGEAIISPESHASQEPQGGRWNGRDYSLSFAGRTLLLEKEALAVAVEKVPRVCVHRR